MTDETRELINELRTLINGAQEITDNVKNRNGDNPCEVAACTAVTTMNRGILRRLQQYELEH